MTTTQPDRTPRPRYGPLLEARIPKVQRSQERRISILSSAPRAHLSLLPFETRGNEIRLNCMTGLGRKCRPIKIYKVPVLLFFLGSYFPLIQPPPPLPPLKESTYISRVYIPGLASLRLGLAHRRRGAVSLLCIHSASDYSSITVHVPFSQSREGRLAHWD